MIVLSQSLIMGAAPPTIRLDTPIILWRSLVSRDTLTVSSEAEDFPAINLANDSTIEQWRAASTAAVVIDVATAGAEVDAVAFARHNFGTTHAEITVEVEIADGEGTTWDEVIAPRLLADNSPVLFRFAPVTTTRVRISISGGSAAPSAAVLYVGKLMVMPGGITAGHVPLDQALQSQIANGRSEAGNFLGRLITGQSAQTSAAFEMIPIDWYYDEMEAFVARGTTGPFFFAWLPLTRPDDVGFSWLMSDPRPSIGSVFFDLTLDYGGITW